MDIKLTYVEKEIEKQEGHKTNLTKLLEGKKGLRTYSSAVNALIRALDQVIYINMDVDDYIANYDDSETKRHNSGDKKCSTSQ